MNLLVGGLGGARIVILAREDFEKFQIFEMHTCLGPGTQMLVRNKRRKLDTISLLLLCIGCVVYWNEFFSSVGQFVC